MTRFVGKTLAIAATLGGLLLAPLSAGATTISECQTQIRALYDATDAAVFKGQNAAKDEAGLKLKLSEASKKLDVAKLADAAGKITDYQSKLLQLVQAGKLDQITTDGSPSYTELNNGAVGVQGCIANIGK